MKTAILTLSLCFGLYTAPSDSQKAQHILTSMYQNIFSIGAHSYMLDFRERRIGNETQVGKLQINIEQNSPLVIRAEVLDPNKGPLVEYNEAENRDQARLTPKQWMPAVNFKADIHGSILRRGHHSITETTLQYFGNIIQKCEANYRRRGIYESGVRYTGSRYYQGKQLLSVELRDKDYRSIPYIVKAGENLITIGEKRSINPYKILELNSDISDYFDIEAGQTIRIPSSYAKRCVIEIDASSFLPHRISVYDEKGLFERYTFNHLTVE